MKQTAVQTALYSALSGDATLTGYLSTAWADTPAIYPDVPQEDADDNSFFPYVTFFPVAATPWDTKSITGGDELYQIDVWSRAGDFDEGAQISDRITAILHRQDLSIAGATHVLTQFEGVDPALDADGETRRHILTFRIIYQEA